MKIEGLQYQLANGNWMDCEERTDDFLALCVKYGKVENEIAAIEKLLSGKTMRNDSADWYSNCRVKPAPRPVVKAEMITCSCGCTIPRGIVMNTSTGTSCPECFDRMSL